jgi:hypothetical protein
MLGSQQELGYPVGRVFQLVPELDELENSSYGVRRLVVHFLLAALGEAWTAEIVLPFHGRAQLWHLVWLVGAGQLRHLEHDGAKVRFGQLRPTAAYDDQQDQ